MNICFNMLIRFNFNFLQSKKCGKKSGKKCGKKVVKIKII